MRFRDFLPGTFQNISTFGSLFFYLTILLFLYLHHSTQPVYLLLIGLLLIYVIIVPLRLLWFCERPISKKYSNIIEKIDAGSFPSMHAARATYLFLQLQYLFYPVSFQFLFYTLIGLVAYSRYYLKKHYPLDCVAGIFVGIVVDVFDTSMLAFIETFIKL